MFEPSLGFSFSHWMIVIVVALIVLGPKDLPMIMRKFGEFMAKMRGLAAEFRASFEDMARQAELDDLRREVQALRENIQTPLIDASFKSELDSYGRDIHDSVVYGQATPMLPAPAAAEPAAEPASAPPAPEAEAEPEPKPKRTRKRKPATSEAAIAPEANP